MYKKWLKQRLTRNMFKWTDSSKDDKVWADYEKCFLESYLSYNLVEPIHLNILLFNRCLSHFCTYLIMKIYVKMSKIWKNGKISKNVFFMNSRDIFMWVMVDENTSPGSVLNTISWSESMYCKKAPSFWTPR